MEMIMKADGNINPKGTFRKAGPWKDRWCLARIFLFLLITVGSFGQTVDKPATQDKITINEAENTIHINCSFADKGMGELIVKDSIRMRLDIHKGDTVYTDAIIDHIEPLSKNSIRLSVQPPLEASIFKTEKTEFILHILSGTRDLKTEKSAILGSAFKAFDLRPYTHTDGMALLGAAITLFFGLSLILFLIKPLMQKFAFKRDYVMKYLDAWKEGKTRIDPFTYVDIGDQDEVVAINNEVMLLGSWKRLKKLPHSKPAKEHSIFFEQMTDKSFFNPLAEKFGKTDRAWYGLIGIFTGWLLYRFLLVLGMGQGGSIGAIFDSDLLQVSTVIGHDILLGVTVGICYAVVLALIDQLRSKAVFSALGSAKIIFIRTAFIGSAFFVQALITAFVFQNPYLNGGIAWCLIGIAFVFPVDFKTNRVKSLLIGSCIGLLAFIIYQVMGIPELREIWGINIPLLLSLAILGCLSSALINSNISKKQILKLRDMGRRTWPIRKKEYTLEAKPGKNGKMAVEEKEKQVLEETVESRP